MELRLWELFFRVHFRSSFLNLIGSRRFGWRNQKVHHRSSHVFLSDVVSGTAARHGYQPSEPSGS